MLVRAGDVAAQAASASDDMTAPLQEAGTPTLWTGDTLSSGELALQAAVQARPTSHDRVSPEQTPTLSTLEFLTTVGAWNGFDASAGVAVERGYRSVSSADADRPRTSLGELRFVPRLRLWNDGAGSALAAAVATSFPTTGESGFAEGPRFEPRILASRAAAVVTLTANAGYLLHVRSDRAGRESSDAILTGAGAGLSMSEDWSLVTELTGRLHATARSASLEDRLRTEAGFALRFSVANVAAQLGGGVRLHGAASDAPWRMMAALSFVVPAAAARTATSVRPARKRSDRARALPEPDYARARAPGRDPAASPPRSVGEPAVPASGVRASNRTWRPSVEPPAAPESSEPTFPVLHFKPNQQRLHADQLAVLDTVASRMKEAPADARFVIDGHADPSGPPDSNRRLSGSRALAVRLHLIRRGIAWWRLTIVAWGASRPVAGQDAAAARRVEFRMIPGE